jgi:hypothetical protein
MSAFLRLLWSGRDRRRPNPSLQERVAQYSMYPPHRNVQAAPQKPPVREGKR